MGIWLRDYFISAKINLMPAIPTVTCKSLSIYPITMSWCRGSIRIYIYPMFCRIFDKIIDFLLLPFFFSLCTFTASRTNNEN